MPNNKNNYDDSNKLIIIEQFNDKIIKVEAMAQNLVY